MNHDAPARPPVPVAQRHEGRRIELRMSGGQSQLLTHTQDQHLVAADREVDPRSEAEQGIQRAPLSVGIPQLQARDIRIRPSNIFHYWVGLPKPLGRRQLATIGVKGGIYGTNYRPVYLASTVYEAVRAVHLIVRFVNERPRIAWRFDALQHDGVPGLPSEERTVVLGQDGVGKCELTPAVGLSHGIAWLW